MAAVPKIFQCLKVDGDGETRNTIIVKEHHNKYVDLAMKWVTPKDHLMRHEGGKLALDGCAEFVGDRIWTSIRALGKFLSTCQKDFLSEALVSAFAYVCLVVHVCHVCRAKKHIPCRQSSSSRGLLPWAVSETCLSCQTSAELAEEDCVHLQVIAVMAEKHETVRSHPHKLYCVNGKENNAETMNGQSRLHNLMVQTARADELLFGLKKHLDAEAWKKKTVDKRLDDLTPVCFDLSKMSERIERLHAWRTASSQQRQTLFKKRTKNQRKAKEQDKNIEAQQNNQTCTNARPTPPIGRTARNLNRSARA